MRKAVFLDRDGTLIEDVPYNGDPSKVQVKPNIVRGLKQFMIDGYLLIIVSNQSGVAKGLITVDQVHRCVQKTIDILSQDEILIFAYYHCPHDENKHCLCRKPMPGMIMEAAFDHDIDLSESIMIGDKISDIRAGALAGCRTAYVGDVIELLGTTGVRPNLIAKNIDEVVDELARV